MSDSPAPQHPDAQHPGSRRRTLVTLVGIAFVLVVTVLALVFTAGTDDPGGTAGPAPSETTSASEAASETTPSETTPSETTTSRQAATRKTTATPAPKTNSAIPEHVLATLAYIDAGDWPEAADAPGTRGGMTFRNNERRLPTSTASGARIAYREWDVNPKKPGRGRDAERIVTGSDGTAWYTHDHYDSFVKIRGPDQ